MNNTYYMTELRLDDTRDDWLKPWRLCKADNLEQAKREATRHYSQHWLGRRLLIATPGLDGRKHIILTKPNTNNGRWKLVPKYKRAR